MLGQNPVSPHPREGTTLTTAVPIDANHNPDGAFFNDHRFMGAFGWERGSGAHTWTTMASVSRASQDILRGFLDAVTDTGINARGLREKIDLTDVYADSHVTWTVRPEVPLVVGGDDLHGNGDASGADFDYHVPLNGSVAVPVTPPGVLDVKIDDRRDFVGGYLSAEWTPVPRLRIDTGIRLNVTNEEREGEAGGGPDTGNDAGAQTHVRPSGSAGAVWSAWSAGPDDVRLFTNYRDTFKPAAVDFGIGEDEGEGVMNFENLVIARTVNGLPSLTNAGTRRFTGFETGASCGRRSARASWATPSTTCCPGAASTSASRCGSEGKVPYEAGAFFRAARFFGVLTGAGSLVGCSTTRRVEKVRRPCSSNSITVWCSLTSTSVPGP